MRGAETWSRMTAIFLKELIQMRRDRLTAAMMLGVPLIMLILFGFAINTDPKGLPTAVISEEQSPIVRTLLTGLETSGYFKMVSHHSDPRVSATLLAAGDVAFVITIPSGFTERLVRGDRPQLLIEADASDPAAASNALNRAETIITQALRHDLKGPLASLAQHPSPVEIVIHPRYNPEGITQYNIVPGLLGVIITMTLVMITGMSMTREVERGSMENLMAMPARPFEVMIGKITPYVGLGIIQTLVVLLAGHYLFAVPFIGGAAPFVIGLTIFIIANLAVGFTFSTIAKSQMQAMQLTYFFFLPSLLLSGFMFPFRGMPDWAQAVGEVLPLTHFLRVIRSVMLKGGGFADVQQEIYAMLAFTVVAGAVAMLRYRRTLD
ncbi:MAG: ABC transporter permease [Rhodospirillaceae bacterium]